MQNSTKSCRLAQQLLVEIPVVGASALCEAQLGRASALRTMLISWRCFCWCAWDAWHQPPAGSLGILMGQQQPQEGQEDSSRTGLGAGMRAVPSCAGHGQPRVSPGAWRGDSPSSGGRTSMVQTAKKHWKPKMPPKPPHSVGPERGGGGLIRRDCSF